jgi:hypothetical protein
MDINGVEHFLMNAKVRKPLDERSELWLLVFFCFFPRHYFVPHFDLIKKAKRAELGGRKLISTKCFSLSLRSLFSTPQKQRAMASFTGQNV